MTLVGLISSNTMDQIDKQTQTYLGRQPILDGNQVIFAYELLFRSADTIAVVDDYLATTTVIINTLMQIGIDTVLDGHIGFINTSSNVLLSDVIELLPADRIVLELLETVTVDAAIIKRCRELKEKGFRLAIDDYIYQSGYDGLFPLIDYIKFDVLLMTPAAVDKEVVRLRQWPQIKFLAEKVEDRSQFEHYQTCGFELFQGFFFAKPILMKRVKLHPTQTVLLRILNLLQSEVELDDICNNFKFCPELSIGLLRLVNSGANRRAVKISSLNQAMSLLGRRQLMQWTQLLLYSQDGRFGASPLMEMAAIRAKTMAMLCEVYPDFKQRRKDVHERAYMTGILSLVDVAIGIEKQQLILELKLSEDIAVALLRHEGFLGDLLCLTEDLESCDFDSITPILARHSLSSRDLQHAHLQALQWFHQLKMN